MAPNQTDSDEAPTASAGGETPLSALSNQVVPSEDASTTEVPPSDSVLWEQFRKYMRLQNNSQTASVPEVEKPSEVPLVMKVDWETTADIEPETFLFMMWRIRRKILLKNWSRAFQLSYIKRHFNGLLAAKVNILARKFSERNPVWDFDAFFKYFEEHFTLLSFELQAIKKFKLLKQGSEDLETHNERFNCFMRYRFRRDEGFKTATGTMLMWYIDSLNPKIQERILLDKDLRSIKSLEKLQELLEKFPGPLLVLGEDKLAESFNQLFSASVNAVQAGNKKKSRSWRRRLKQSKKRPAQAQRSKFMVSKA